MKYKEGSNDVARFDFVIRSSGSVLMPSSCESTDEFPFNIKPTNYSLSSGQLMRHTTDTALAKNVNTAQRAISLIPDYTDSML